MYSCCSVSSPVDGHTRATDEHLRSLPQSLRENLNLSLRRHLIEAVPLFRALTTFELMELLHAMDTRITMPDEIIIRAGTVGNEMSPPRRPRRSL